MYAFIHQYHRCVECLSAFVSISRCYSFNYCGVQQSVDFHRELLHCMHLINIQQSVFYDLYTAAEWELPYPPRPYTTAH